MYVIYHGSFLCHRCLSDRTLEEIFPMQSRTENSSEVQDTLQLSSGTDSRHSIGNSPSENRGQDPVLEREPLEDVKNAAHSDEKPPLFRTASSEKSLYQSSLPWAQGPPNSKSETAGKKFFVTKRIYSSGRLFERRRGRRKEWF